MRLILHIGAHRTASTLIERMLSALATAQPDLGLAVWKPADMRAIPGFKAAPGLLNRAGAPHSPEAAESFDAVRENVAARLDAAERAGVKTLLISEENICGGMRTNFKRGRFYPAIGPRLLAFARVLGRTPARVALGLREYGAVWNSAYGYLDRAENTLPAPGEAAQILMDRPRGWPALVAAMREAWASSDLMVWRQEDLGAQAAAAALCDVDPALLIDPERQVNATGSAGGRTTELFSPAERRKLARRYERHVSTLLEDPNLSWAVRP
ncbi:MAG: hypothetical protein AAFP28_06315 [Pseudomonadota bacterium]